MTRPTKAEREVLEAAIAFDKDWRCKPLEDSWEAAMALVNAVRELKSERRRLARELRARAEGSKK